MSNARGSFAIECVDSRMLYYSLEHSAQYNHGNGVSDAWVHEATFHNAELLFSSERYAMDGNGMHVGYEGFTAELPIHEYTGAARNKAPLPIGIDNERAGYVIPEELEVRSFHPAEEPHEYTHDDAFAYLLEYFGDEFTEDELNAMDEDDVLDIAFDRMMGEGDYTPPDDDFAWQELDHHLRQALDNLPSAKFVTDEKGRRWEVWFDGDDEPHKVFWIERLEDKNEQPA